MRTLRVISWNLRHGGGNTRTPEQALFLQSLSPDIIALSEVREARGSQLRVMLADAGLVHWLEPDAPSTRNRVAIASRFALVPEVQVTWRARFIAARIERFGLHVQSVHVPDENKERARAEVWQLIVEQARSLRDSRAVIAGDFNTQRTAAQLFRPTATTDSDPETVQERTAWRAGRRVGQSCEHLMGMLSTLGFVDLTSPRVCDQKPTWFGPSGEQHAIDGIWASKPLVSSHSGNFPSAFRETRCVEEGLSDHAAIGVDLIVSEVGSEQRDAPAKPQKGGLFSSD